MRVFFVTEGVGEFKGLPKLYAQLSPACGISLKTLQVSVAGDAPTATVVRRSISHIRMAISLKADLIVLLLDREQQDSCSGQVADEISTLIRREIGNLGSARIEVVLKDRMFENWLIADLRAIKAQPARFKLTPSVVKKIEPDKADKCDAYALLKRMAIGGAYDKVVDGVRICEKLDIINAAANSRSLRHLLHVLGHPLYRDSCRRSASVAVPLPRASEAARGIKP